MGVLAFGSVFAKSGVDPDKVTALGYPWSPGPAGRPNQWGWWPNPEPRPAPFSALPAMLVKIATDARNLPLAERMAAVSAPMLGSQYQDDPLGEGVGFDPDPLARYDAFDCIGFVEEVLALSLAGDPVHAGDLRRRIRYGDRPATYGHRRHFMEMEWLPGNVADGFLVETTKQYGETVHLEKQVKLSDYARFRRKKPFSGLTDDELPVGTMQLDVIPLEAAEKIAGDIRPGSIVLSVRKEYGFPVWTNHVGFVVQGPKGPMLRDASRRQQMAIVDERLVSYVKLLSTYKVPMAGIAIFEPVDPDPRLSALTPSGTTGAAPP